MRYASRGSLAAALFGVGGLATALGSALRSGTALFLGSLATELVGRSRGPPYFEFPSHWIMEHILIVVHGDCTR
jgi:hypothetical protein